MKHLRRLGKGFLIALCMLVFCFLVGGAINVAAWLAISHIWVLGVLAAISVSYLCGYIASL